MFREIARDGHINLEMWISWATEHIAAKASSLTKVILVYLCTHQLRISLQSICTLSFTKYFSLQDFLGGHTSDVTKDEFAAFIKKATVKGTPEYSELYYFLLSCFQAGDAHKVTCFCLKK